MSLEWKTYLLCDERGKDVTASADETGRGGFPKRPDGKRAIRTYAEEKPGRVRRRGSDFCADCAEVGLDPATA